MSKSRQTADSIRESLDLLHRAERALGKGPNHWGAKAAVARVLKVEPNTVTGYYTEGMPEHHRHTLKNFLDKAEGLGDTPADTVAVLWAAIGEVVRANAGRPQTVERALKFYQDYLAARGELTPDEDPDERMKRALKALEDLSPDERKQVQKALPAPADESSSDA